MQLYMSEGTRSRSDSIEVAYRKIFIGGLSYSTDEDKLRKYFKTYGTVQDAVVMKDPVTKRSRGFGFITFSEVSSVDIALANEPHTIDTRKVEAKRAVPRSEMAKDTVNRQQQQSMQSYPLTPLSTQQSPSSYPPSVPKSPSMAGYSITTPNESSPGTLPHNKSSASLSSYSSASSSGSYNPLYDSRGALDPRINMEEYAYNKVFVGGLHYDTRDGEFRSYFEKYGKVVSAEVMFNRETHKSRGFGFIVFELEQGAIKVCTEKEHYIDGKLVEVKRAIPRSKILSTNNITPPPSKSSSISTPSTTTARLPLASPNNIRDNIRRTFSAGNGQQMPLSAQSLSAIAAMQASKIAPISLFQNSSPPTGKGASPSSGKPAPSKLGIVSTSANSRSVSATSYAAALKLGSNYQEYEDDIMLRSDDLQGGGRGGDSTNNSALGMNLGLMSLGNNGGGSGNKHMESGLIEHLSSSGSLSLPLGNMNMNKMMDVDTSNSMQGQGMQSMTGQYKSPGMNIDLSRPYRSYSEPIIKFEGYENFLEQHHDISGMYQFGGTVRPTQSSNHSSRSSSFYVPHNTGQPFGLPLEGDSGLSQLGNLHGPSPSISRLNSVENLNRNSAAHGNQQSPSLAGLSWLSTPPQPVNSIEPNTSFLSLQLPPAAVGAGSGSISGSGSAKSAGGIAVMNDVLDSSIVDIDSMFAAYSGSSRTSGSGLGSTASLPTYQSPLTGSDHQTSSPFFNQTSPPQQQPSSAENQHYHGVPTIDVWNSMFLNPRPQQSQLVPSHTQQSQVQSQYDSQGQAMYMNNSVSEDSIFQPFMGLGYSQQDTQSNVPFYFHSSNNSNSSNNTNEHQLQQQQQQPQGTDSVRQVLFSDLQGGETLSGRPVEFTETDEFFKIHGSSLGGGASAFDISGSSMPNWLSDSNARR